MRKNFPIYSQEFYAAVWRYYYFVEEDDYKVGYLASEMGWRFSHEDDAVRGKKFDSKSTPRTGKATEANKNDRKKREQIVENFLSKMSPDKWNEFKAKSSGRIKVRPLARYIGSQNLFEGKVKTGMATESIEKVINAYLEKSNNTSN